MPLTTQQRGVYRRRAGERRRRHRRSGWGVNTKGRRSIEEDGRGCEKRQKSRFPRTEWELWGGAVEGRSRTVSAGEVRVHTSNRKPSGGSSGSAFRSSPIGLANKLVQFKKRPLNSCSLKAAYTKNKKTKTTYEKNLRYQELQNTENFTSTSVLLYIHKRGCKMKMTEKERVS